MIIGNKKSFAIEFTQLGSNPKMGHGKLWIQNQFYGTNQDLIYLQGYLISLIDELINIKKIDFDFDKLSETELFEKFEQRENRDDYLVHGSTFTDDFIAYSFEKRGTIYLVWKICNDKEILFSDLKDYGTDVKFCNVKKIEIENIKNELLKRVS